MPVRAIKVGPAEDFQHLTLCEMAQSWAMATFIQKPWGELSRSSLSKLGTV